MMLKVLNGKPEMQVSDTAFGREIQRSSGAPGGDGLPGRRPRRHQGAEDPRGSARRRQKAARPEGHGPGARRLEPQSHLGRRGRAFAAKPRDFTQKVNRKMYQGAIRSMLSELARQDRLRVVDEIALEAGKTRLLVNQLKDWELENVLIIVEAVDEKLFLAARNLYKVEVLEVGKLNPVALVSHDNVLMTVAAVKLLEERLQ